MDRQIFNISILMHLQENGYTRGGYPGFPKLGGKKERIFQYIVTGE